MKDKFGILLGRLFPNPTYYGWVIVGMGFLCSALTSPGQSFVISLYLEPVMSEIGISRLEISSLFGTATLAAAVCLPLVGKIADRVPSGLYLGVVLALLGVAMVGLSQVTTVAGLIVAFFFLRLLGQGAVGLGTITATVRWFRRYRGRALALVGLGYAFGQLVYPGIVYGLLERLGWRGSLLAMAGVYLLVAGPLTFRVVRERGSFDGPVDGEAHPLPHDIRPLADFPDPSFSLAAALRMPVFWGLLLAVVILPLAHTAMIFHQVALFSSRGWGASLVPTAFIAYALGGVGMAYGTGVFLERYPARYGLALALGLSALAFGAVSLPLAPVPGALLFGTLLGMAGGIHSASSSIVWPDFFGIEALGAVRGVVSAGVAAASAVGPPLAALLVGEGGTFESSLVAFSSICAVGAVLSLRLRKPPVETRDPLLATTKLVRANG